MVQQRLNERVRSFATVGFTQSLGRDLFPPSVGSEHSILACIPMDRARHVEQTGSTVKSSQFGINGSGRSWLGVLTLKVLRVP